MSQTDCVVVAGKLGAAHGLKGWLKLYSFTEPLDKILDYQPWFIKRATSDQVLVCDAYRWQGQQLVVHFVDLDSREATAYLTNQLVYIKASQLPRLKAGEYYWQQLIGLQVRNIEGHEFGKVVSLMATGANDVLMIEGEKQHCLPYLPKQVIKQIDLAAGLMVVDWPAEF